MLTKIQVFIKQNKIDYSFDSFYKKIFMPITKE